MNGLSGNKTLNILNKKYVKSLVENANPNIKMKTTPRPLDIEDTSFENKPLIKLQTLDLQNKLSAISKRNVASTRFKTMQQMQNEIMGRGIVNDIADNAVNQSSANTIQK